MKFVKIPHILCWEEKLKLKQNKCLHIGFRLVSEMAEFFSGSPPSAEYWNVNEIELLAQKYVFQNEKTNF